VFVPVKNFQTSLMFVGEASSLPYSGASEIMSVKSFLGLGQVYSFWITDS